MGLVNAGGMNPMTFKSGNEGFKFYLFASDIEAFLTANPDEKYISGLAVANTQEKGPDWNLSIFDNKDDPRGGGRDGGGRTAAPPARQAPAPQAEAPAQDPYEAPALAAAPPTRGRRGTPAPQAEAPAAPSGNRRSTRGGRGGRGRQ